MDRIYSVIVGGEPAGAGVRRLNLLYGDAERLVRSAHLDNVLERFESDVELAVAELARGWVFVHSAVVGWTGAAILLPGTSGSGKTTLALELVRAGATYYSDEFAVLDRRGRVHPFARSATMRNPETGEARRVPLEPAAAAGLMPLPVGLVVATEYREGADWKPRSLSRAEAVLALLANAIAVRREPARVIAALERATARGRALEGPRGEAGAVAGLILEALEYSQKGATVRRIPRLNQ
jgi:hypothetical protein